MARSNRLEARAWSLALACWHALPPEERTPEAALAQAEAHLRALAPRLVKLADVPPRAWRPWTATDDRELARGVAAGLSVRALAELLGRAPGGIEARIKLRGS